MANVTSQSVGQTERPGPNSIENFWLEFWLENSLKFRLRKCSKMGSLDMSQNQNGISIRFSSQNSSQFFFYWIAPLHRLGVPLPELVPEGRVDGVFAVGAEDGTRRVEGQDSFHCGIPVLFPAIMTMMEEFLIWGTKFLLTRNFTTKKFFKIGTSFLFIRNFPIPGKQQQWWQTDRLRLPSDFIHSTLSSHALPVFLSRKATNMSPKTVADTERFEVLRPVGFS